MLQRYVQRFGFPCIRPGHVNVHRCIINDRYNKKDLYHNLFSSASISPTSSSYGSKVLQLYYPLYQLTPPHHPPPPTPLLSTKEIFHYFEYGLPFGFTSFLNHSSGIYLSSHLRHTCIQKNRYLLSGTFICNVVCHPAQIIRYIPEVNEPHPSSLAHTVCYRNEYIIKQRVLIYPVCYIESEISSTYLRPLYYLNGLTSQGLFKPLPESIDREDLVDFESSTEL